MSAFGVKADIGQAAQLINTFPVGKAPAATSTSTYLPVGFPFVIQIAAGEQVSALGNDSTAGTLNVTECLT